MNKRKNRNIVICMVVLALSVAPMTSVIGHADCSDCSLIDVMKYIFGNDYPHPLVWELISSPVYNACCLSDLGSPDCSLDLGAGQQYSYYLCTGVYQMSIVNPCRCAGFWHGAYAIIQTKDWTPIQGVAHLCQ